jgi:hypothetical protein
LGTDNGRQAPKFRRSLVGPRLGLSSEALIYATVLPGLRMLRLAAVAFVAGAAALCAPVAMAESAATIDCVRNGRLTHNYTVAELRTALNTMPAEVQEYNSDCYQIILNQLNAQLGGAPVQSTTTAAPAPASGSSLISTPLLVALCVVVVAGGGFALAARRRDKRGGSGGDGD